MARPALRELGLVRRMALRVRLIAALELRDEGLPESDERGHERQRALKLSLLASTRDFGSNGAVSAAEMIEYARRQLGNVEAIENPTVKRRFDRIANALDRFTCNHCLQDPAAARRCVAEIYELFGLIDRHVLSLYRDAAGNFAAPEIWLEIGYHHEDEIADVMDASALSGASRIADQADLIVSVVTLGVRDHGLDWRSLCQLPYILMHELVCHAYQGAASTGRTAVDASCAWSEGWMDALAAIQIEAWLEGRRKKPGWVEMNAAAIKRATAGLHERRYQRQSSLRPFILSQRVAARDGFAALVEAFRGADTRLDRALARATRFSGRLNLESMAQEDRTKLVARLASDLESYFGLRRAELVGACARYADDGDLAKFRVLLDALET